ncbi:gamma-interferon-inducible lysosomal thiol reductase-like protein isoform X2 [Lycorma delicatula]
MTAPANNTFINEVLPLNKDIKLGTEQENVAEMTCFFLPSHVTETDKSSEHEVDLVQLKEELLDVINGDIEKDPLAIEDTDLVKLENFKIENERVTLKEIMMEHAVPIFLVVIIIATASGQHSGSSVNMTIFYETLCPYSMKFFTSQLGPVWKEFNNYINVEFIPYGHANQTYQNGTWNFKCQHGDNECKYNIYHACVINNIKNVDKVVRILTCLMTDKQESRLIDSCMSENTIKKNTKDKVTDCSNNNEGRELLSAYGNETNNFQPKVQYVPSPVFNGALKESDRVDAYYNLKEVVCKYLNPKPPQCSNHYYYLSVPYF